MRTRRLPLSLVSLVVTVTLLGGCGSDAGGKGAEGAPDPEQSLPQSELAKAWADYDRRNNAALEKTGPPKYDASAFAAADTGAMLAGDRYNVRVDQLKGEPAGKPFTHMPGTVFAPGIEEPFALTTYTTKSGADDTVGLASLVRKDSNGPWLMEASVGIPRADIPTALPNDQDATASADDVARAREVLDQMVGFLQTGKAPDGVQLRTLRTEVRKGLVETTKSVPGLDIRLTAALQPFGGRAFEDTVRVVRVEDGLLVVAPYRLDAIFRVGGSADLGYSGLDGAVYGTERTRRLLIPRAVTIAVHLPDTGPPVVLGTHTAKLLK